MRRTTFVALGCVLSLTSVVAQRGGLSLPASSDPQAPSHTENLRIHGEVRVEGGDPIGDVRIRTDAIRGPMAGQFTASKNFTTHTEANGKFSLIGVTRGLWILELSHRDYLPHVVVAPIFMMVQPEPQPWETGLALLPKVAVVPADLPPNAPEHAIIEAGRLALAAGPKADIVRLLQKLEGASLHAGSLVAAGDAALLIREPNRAIKFFELAIKVAPEWYRPHLGVASAAMMKFETNIAIKAYMAARALTKTEALKGMLSLSVRDLQQVVDKGRLGASPLFRH